MRDRDSITALGIASELGFGIAGPMVVCTGLGWYLDGQFGTGHWLVMIGLLFGLMGAGYTFYRLATAFPTRKPGATAATHAGRPDASGTDPLPPAASPDDTESTRSNTE
jgi:F0F1-type ATP synthase assembly protein I